MGFLDYPILLAALDLYADTIKFHTLILALPSYKGSALSPLPQDTTDQSPGAYSEDSVRRILCGVKFRYHQGLECWAICMHLVINLGDALDVVRHSHGDK
jgi:hypothetical protein